MSDKNENRSFLDKLGLGRARALPSNGDAPLPANALRGARHHLMDEIAEFLLGNDLEVSAANLCIAHGAFSGTNPGLRRAIESRMSAGLPITQKWLSEATASSEEVSELDRSNRLLTTLQSSLDKFSKNAGTALKETSAYGQALEDHVADLAGAQDAENVIANLAALTQMMLERTRTAEAEMRRSTDEAKSLRDSLSKARHDAEIDHLTGLPNRRAFETLLEKHYAAAKSEIDALSVAFCDIDHFKKVNDTHGHDAGDRVIKEIAATLAAISDDNCHVARHGGEEFVMLFRGLRPSAAKARLDELRERLATREMVNRATDLPFGTITFSAGVADVFGYLDPRQALKAADEALYRAKEAGRNQVVIAQR